MNREKLVHCAEIYKIRDRKINILDTATIRKPKKKETLLFIPGAGGSIWNWKYQLKYFFDKGYRVIAYDPVGHGGSEIVDKYDFKEQYKDFLQILRKTNVDKNLVLVSHSSATQISLRFLRGPGKHIKRSILVSATLHDGDGLLWKSFISLPKIFAYSTYCILSLKKSSIIRSIFFSKKTSIEAVRDFINENHLPPINTLQIFKSYLHVDNAKGLNNIKHPSLIVLGDDDKLVDLKESKKLESKLPKSSFVVLKNTGHMCFYEKPNIFNKKVLNFI
ncbi:MAG: alpha/beta fold hydrolase [Nanoarchaeota archaeon]